MFDRKMGLLREGAIAASSLADEKNFPWPSGENIEIMEEFWQHWSEYREALYRCCFKLMNFNPTDAEDALSQAMLLAYEKVQRFAGEIVNLKTWLMQLTHNLCIDINRKRARGAAGVENIEWLQTAGEIEFASWVETPEKALEREEKSMEIRRAIASLPERLRDTFVLHFYLDKSHQEIAFEQGISYDNVCKRISLARKKLKDKLNSYFRGEEGNDPPKSTLEKFKAEESQEREGAIATPIPESLPEVVEDKPPAVVKEELKEAENEEISELPGNTEERSLELGLPEKLPAPTTEENGSVCLLGEETGAELARSPLSEPTVENFSAHEPKILKHQPEKLPERAAIQSLGRIVEVNERSLFLRPLVGLLSSAIFSGRQAIAFFLHKTGQDLSLPGSDDAYNLDFGFLEIERVQVDRLSVLSSWFANDFKDVAGQALAQLEAAWMKKGVLLLRSPPEA